MTISHALHAVQEQLNPAAQSGEAGQAVPPKIEVKDVSKTFRVNGRIFHALQGINLHARDQEFVTLIGPSGCGKSTLFNIISGLLQPDRGEVCIDGQCVVDRLGRIGYMPQKDLLLPWRTVLDNVVLCAELNGVPKQERYRRARELLPLFGLEGFASSYPAALSGGMKQRAALLRTFLCQQEIVLLDEPFGALDAITRIEMQEWLLEVWESFRQTILFITHDVQEAVFLSDRVYVMSPRPARISLEVQVDFPRPRHHRIVSDPRFVALSEQLFNALKRDNHERQAGL
jgi:ABC-type nitrate/sulfonate/bicarbonate transport system ATPase subunit